MIPRLCFITDAGASLPILDQAEGAARGGAGWVQLRDKTLPDADFATLARDLISRLEPLGVPLIINDRVEVARQINAPGLHIGQSDGDPKDIRDRIGSDMILGLSIEAEHQIHDVPDDCVTYLGVGPIRATGSKPDHAPPMGFDGLARTVAATDLPCMAIGGLTAIDMPAVMEAGCKGIAIISAISRSADPEAAAAAFLEGESL
ncbi:MAG: thiamine phosphate synthase [Pseudomonadota bacterium]